MSAPDAGAVEALVEAGRSTRFRPGRSGNPGHKTRYEIELRRAIETQETPARVCAVVDAMRRAGMKGDARAAQVYLRTVGAELGDADKITRALKQHLDNLMAEAERLEAVEQEKTQRALPPTEDGT